MFVCASDGGRLLAILSMLWIYRYILENKGTYYQEREGERKIDLLCMCVFVCMHASNYNLFTEQSKLLGTQKLLLFLNR